MAQQAIAARRPFFYLTFIPANESLASRCKSLKQALSVGAAEPGAGIPMSSRLVVAIVALRDVSESGVRWPSVQQGIDKSCRLI